MYSYKYSFCFDLRRFVCLSFVSYSLLIGFLELQFKNVHLQDFANRVIYSIDLQTKKKQKPLSHVLF